MEKKIDKRFLILKKIEFELISLKTHFYSERILIIEIQYIYKLSQDFRYKWERIFRTEVISK